MMKKDLIIKDVYALLDNHEIQKTDILICDGKFKKIGGDIYPKGIETLNGSNYTMIPGIVNLHDDSFEHFLFPRRSFKIQNIDVKSAFANYWMYCLWNGITTNCITLTASLEPGIRNWALCNKLLGELSTVINDVGMKDNIKINYRYEITTGELQNLSSLIKQKMVHLVTFSDHTAQGLSDWDEEKYFRNINYRTKLDKENYERIFDNLDEKRERFWSEINQLDLPGQRKDIRFGIHDIREPFFLDQFSFDFLEFPLQIDIAEIASKRSIKILMGAPNYLYGTSQDHGIDVKDIIAKNIDVCLCSDYFIPSMMQILNQWYLHKEDYSLIDMVTSLPGELLHVNKGRISEGYDADFLLLSDNGQGFILEYSFIKGQNVYKNLLK